MSNNTNSNVVEILSATPMTSASFGVEHGEVVVDTFHEGGERSFFTAGDNADAENPTGFKRILTPETREWVAKKKICVRRRGKITPDAIRREVEIYGRKSAVQRFLAAKEMGLIK